MVYKIRTFLDSVLFCIETSERVGQNVDSCLKSLVISIDQILNKFLSDVEALQAYDDFADDVEEHMHFGVVLECLCLMEEHKHAGDSIPLDLDGLPYMCMASEQLIIGCFVLCMC